MFLFRVFHVQNLTDLSATPSPARFTALFQGKFLLNTLCVLLA